MVNIYQSTLVIDIETTGLDFNKNGIKRVGMYSYQTKQFILTSDLDEVQRILNRHETIVGYNINEFDEPFLNAKGVMIKGKVLDLYHILKKRIPIIKHKFDSLKLKNACDKLGLGMKGDIDLNVLIAENNTDEEKVLIDKYLKQDVQITKNLYEWFENEFSVFKQFIPMSDAMNYGHLTLSVGGYAYKAVCKMSGLPELYNHSAADEQYKGGFVLTPRKLVSKGRIICLDFNCLPKGELVHTIDGYKRIEDIGIGDKTISVDRKENTFVNKIKQIANQLIVITLTNGTVLQMTPNHRILTNSGPKKASDVTCMDMLLAPNETNVRKYFGKNEFDFFKLLGIFVCEGRLDEYKRWVVDNKHPNGRWSTARRTQIHIKTHETDFKNEIESLLKTVMKFTNEETRFYKLTLQEKKKKQVDGILYSSLCINSTRQAVYHRFNRFKNIFYNIDEITASEERMKGFLSGCLKSDGTWNTPRKSITILTTEQLRAECIKKCLECLGIHYSCSLHTDGTKEQKKVKYSIEIYYKNELDKLFSWFKFDSYRDDKITDYSDKNNHNADIENRHIKKIETINGNFEVYDLTMERQECPYFIHNGVFTHNSAYPHAFMMQNLYSVAKDGEPFYSGNDIYTLRGKYKTSEMGIIEKTIQKLFALRYKYKKLKDPREYAIKIILNTMYGITGNPKFISVYNIDTASDCTLTVRSWILYALKIFEEEGYIVIYGDTDSVYLEDVFNDDARLLAVKDRIIKDIKDRVPFPLDTFDMGIDERISSIYFFENKDKKSIKAKKKSYIYITDDKELVIKGLAVIKRNSSKLSKLIVKKLTQEMIDNNDIFFSKKLINDMIIEELNKDINIARTKFNIGSKSSYTSTTSIQMAILEKYGEGTHKLIKNKKIGVGKGVKYCTLEEAKTLTIADLDLSTIWNELSPFIKTAPVRSVFSF